MRLAKANTPRHADKLRELAVAGHHEDAERRKCCDCVSSLLLPSFPAPELRAGEAGGQIVSLRLGADPTLAASKPWRSSAEADARKANLHSGFTGSAAPELVHPVRSTVLSQAAQPVPTPSLHWAGSLLRQSKLLSASNMSCRLSPVCSG